MATLDPAHNPGNFRPPAWQAKFRQSICDNYPSLRPRKTLYHPCRSSGRLWR